MTMDLNALQANLEKRGFSCRIFPTGADAARYLNETIDGTSVAFGGSMTVSQLDLPASLAAHNHVISHWNIPEGMTRAEVFAAAAVTDVYLSSVNGISMQGDLVNIDGAGNRVSSTLFGHKKVVFLVGKNKIAPDLTAAMHRARNIAAPKNAMRLGRKTPCAVRGDRCYDCNSPERICNGFVILSRPMYSCKAEVLLIDEELGF